MWATVQPGWGFLLAATVSHGYAQQQQQQQQTAKGLGSLSAQRLIGCLLAAHITNLTLA
jgi:hypothetical protein